MQFTVAANQSVFLDLQQLSPVNARIDFTLKDPSGSTVFTSSTFPLGVNGADKGPMTLSQGGTYTLVVTAKAMTREVSSFRCSTYHQLSKAHSKLAISSRGNYGSVGESTNGLWNVELAMAVFFSILSLALKSSMEGV